MKIRYDFVPHQVAQKPMLPPPEPYAYKDPCPWRIVTSTIGCGIGGALFSTVLYTYYGFKYAPHAKLRGSLALMRMGTPIMAANFAILGGMLSTFECALVVIRGRDDGINTIISGGITCGIICSRSGVPGMLIGALAGSAAMAIIMGIERALSGGRYRDGGQRR